MSSKNDGAELDPAKYLDQMDMSLFELAMIFASKGWITKTGNPPTAYELADIIDYLVEVVEASDEEGCWSNHGRIMITQDPEYPSYYSVSLELGLIPKVRG